MVEPTPVPDRAHRHPGPTRPQTFGQVLDLTSQLRRLSTPGAARNEHERAAFLADRAARLARIPATAGPSGSDGAA